MNNSVVAFDPCGIEVSQLTLVVALRAHDHDEPLREFPNTPQGHQGVRRFLERSARPVRVAMESTGLYGLDLALALHQAGVAVMVANPRAVRHFATALMQRSKNDHRDAAVLREFAARMPFQAWRPPSPTALKLVAVARRLEALTDMMAAEKNRRHAAMSCCSPFPASASPAPCTRWPSSLSCPLAWMSASGWPTPASIRANIPPELRCTKKSASRSPVTNTCGAVFHMPALVAVRHDPHLRAYYEHLLAKGKTKMQALVATMRKLLHAIFGMFKHDQLFDGRKVYAALDVPAPAPAPAPQEVLCP